MPSLPTPPLLHPLLYPHSLPPLRSSPTSTPPTLPPFPFPPSPPLPHSAGDYAEELWKACAGSLAYVPQNGDRILYFPQGHMEQVAASTQQQQQEGSNCQELPNSGLVPQILCRVVNRLLSAEKDTDEVYAQVSLLPELTDITIKDPSFAEANKQPNATPARPRTFIKILTASDTSTHGGFSVLRKHAEECLPPLDMTQDMPSQELTATDLHGHEWKFRHTYRGQPRRHLLTTGWSVFVSHKRLVAGDAVIFLRGSNGELRVGIRRAKCQQSAQQAVMSSHSMHMGIVATASHALGTRTIFSVYYKPRASLSSFLVPVDKVAKSMSVSLSVGMRFKMRFEAEDATDRSYAGTIMAIEDLDAKNWPNSKWRSVKVKWDEMFHKERQERVSPWEIESSPAVTPPPRNKRFYPSLSPPCPLSDVSGSSDSPTGGVYSPKITRVLQGQEIQNSASHSLRKNRADALPSQPHHDFHVQPQYPQLTSHSVTPSIQQHSFSLHNFVPECKSDSKLSSMHFPFENGARNGISHAMMHGVSSEPKPLGSRDDLRLMPSLPFSGLASFERSDARKNEKDALSMSNDVTSSLVAAESGCKIFGVSLTGGSPAVAKECKHANVESAETHGRHLKCEHAQITEPEILNNAGQSILGESHNYPHSTRTCIKVIKKGSMVGRGIDLTRFDSYTSLFEALEAMFHMEGELTDPKSGWQVVYSDDDGDTMKVGDDPWLEFCTLAKKLCIWSPEDGDASVVT